MFIYFVGCYAVAKVKGQHRSVEYLDKESGAGRYSQISNSWTGFRSNIITVITIIINHSIQSGI